MTKRVFKTVAGTTAFAATAAFAIASAAQPAHAAAAPPKAPGAVQHADNLPNPRAEKQAAERQVAVDQLVKGTAKVKTINGSKVIELQAPSKGKGKNLKKGKYVQYDPNQTTKIFTTLAEFGDKTKPAQGGEAGPLRNTIPQPDRANDNSTYWVDDFNQAHFDNLFNGAGESFRNFYKDQSQGRFDVTTEVDDWVQVPYNEARYGHNPVDSDGDGKPDDGTSEAEGYWSFVQDSLTAWYNKQVESGKSKAEIKQGLQQFDTWDRYDFDGDGDFNEPDGYIDHYEAIHAGVGEEAGGGAQGDDAIWSHRWAVQYGVGTTGPAGNKSGGVEIGDTGIWVQDYTTEPENGGLGVFAHEFAHDLGLPDMYDTTNRGDNTVGFWSLMSSGSWLNDGGDSIGTTPGYMDAWSKVQLGWSDLQTVKFGEDANVDLGPADEDNRRTPQALAISLPDKSITTDYNTPKSGTYEWWSGEGNMLNNTLTREIDLTGVTSASLSTAAWYDTEPDFDFVYAQVSTDGGANWTDVGDPINGAHKSWTDLSFDLTPYAGQKVQFRFAYVTDQAAGGVGAFFDDITVTKDGVATVDDVESADSAWTPKGFKRIDGSDTVQVSHYYLAESRRYSGYDTTLQTGPYNFGFGPDRPDWVEHFPYQDGLLVWYVDGQYADNNTTTHPGHGLVLPVDAHPMPAVWKTGTVASNRIQSYDSTFGVHKTDKFTLHRQGTTLDFPKQAGVPVFDDSVTDAYWSPLNPTGSVKVAGTGTQIIVKGAKADGLRLQVRFTK